MSNHDELLKKFTKLVKQLAAMPEQERKRLLKMMVVFFEEHPGEPKTESGEPTPPDAPEPAGDANGTAANGSGEPAGASDATE